ncbi:capsular biosynthesis protein, partial [Klebsiella oxytoca]
PHILLLRLFEVYDVKLYEAVKMQSPFHKLSYKFSDEQIQLKGTFYEKLFGSDCNV